MIILLIVFLVIMLIPIVLAQFSETFRWILIAYFCITIYFFVRRFIGSGLLTYVITGILIYIFVVRLFYLFTAMYMIYLVASLGLSGILIFGLPRGGMGKKAGMVGR